MYYHVPPKFWKEAGTGYGGKMSKPQPVANELQQFFEDELHHVDLPFDSWFLLSFLFNLQDLMVQRPKKTPQMSFQCLNIQFWGTRACPIDPNYIQVITCNYRYLATNQLLQAVICDSLLLLPCNFQPKPT